MSKFTYTGKLKQAGAELGEAYANLGLRPIKTHIYILGFLNVSKLASLSSHWHNFNSIVLIWTDNLDISADVHK